MEDRIQKIQNDINIYRERLEDLECALAEAEKEMREELERREAEKEQNK